MKTVKEKINEAIVKHNIKNVNNTITIKDTLLEDINMLIKNRILVDNSIVPCLTVITGVSYRFKFYKDSIKVVITDKISKEYNNINKELITLLEDKIKEITKKQINAIIRLHGYENNVDILEEYLKKYSGKISKSGVKGSRSLISMDYDSIIDCINNIKNI